MRAAAWSCPLALFAAAAAAAQTGTLVQRLRSFAEELAAMEHKEPGPLSDDDMDLVDQAQIDVERFTSSDLAGIVVMLRFGKTLRDEDLPAATGFAASKEGRAIAWPLQMLLALRGRMDDAALLTVSMLADVPKDRRSYSTWKRWEYFFGQHADRARLSYEFNLALMRRFDAGTAAEQAVIADLFDKPGLTRAQVAELRAEMEKGWVEYQARLLKQPAEPSAKVWIEDRKGLRQVEAKALRRKDRFEIRLQRPGPSGAASAPWGALTGDFMSDSGSLLAKHAALRSLAEAAGDAVDDFAPGIGPIAIVLKPGEETDHLQSRIENLDDDLTHALAASTMAIAMSTHLLPTDPARVERCRTTAKSMLAAVRAAAQRLRQLTTADARRKPPDESGDDAVLAALKQVSDEALVWIAALDALLPAEGGSWRNMQFAHQVPKSRHRTQVLTGKDSLTIAELDITPDVDGGPRIVRSLTTVTLQPADLRDAKFETAPNDNGGTCELRITTSRPVGRQWSSLGGVSEAVGSGNSSSLSINCDTDAHRQELITGLQRFAERR